MMRVYAPTGMPVDDRRPRLAVIGRLPEVRLEVVLLIPVGRDVRGAGIEVRRLDHRGARELAIRRRRDVRPSSAAVARDVNQPVVAARPTAALS